MFSLKSLAFAGTLLAVAYGGVVLYFKLSEDSFVYHPDRSAYAPPADSLDLNPRRLTLRASDSVDLAAWAIAPPATVPADSAGWLLYCHGNGGNIGTPGYGKAWAMLKRLGLGILAVDYRGYGESGGTPSEPGLYRDAEAAYAYLRDSLDVPPSRIIFYGFSLGSAVAVDLATRLPGAALVIEGAILSVPHRGKELYPFIPVFSLARNRYASIDKIGRVGIPKLFVHSREDRVNPIAHSRALHAAAPEPKQFLEVIGGHSTAYRLDPSFMPGVGRFLAGLGFPVPRPGV